MKVLVAGGTGFIGRHLCDELSKKHDVTAIGRNDSIHDIFSRRIFDAVFHLAANAEIIRDDAHTDIQDTLNTTLTLLKACADNGVRQFVFTSSGAIYGETGAMVSEDSVSLRPLSHYAAAKVASEAFISSFSNLYGIQSWVFRLPNVIAEDSSKGIILNFINQLKEGQLIHVWGDGTVSKPYIHVSDCVGSIIYAWESAKEQYNCFNVAGGGLMSVREIAETVVMFSGEKRPIIYTGEGKMWDGDIGYYCPIFTKLLKLGWKPSMDSRTAVEYTIKRIYDNSKSAI